MIDDFRENLKNFFRSRLFVLTVIMILLFTLLLGKAFSLQIIKGQYYQENFTMNITRTLTVDAARGNIYDCNGKLLAGNELAYSVLLADSGNYENSKEKNELLNREIAEIVSVFDKNGEKLVNNFQISYSSKNGFQFNVSGTALKRFLADIFGQAEYENLKYNETFGFDEANATAEQVMDYLMHDKQGGYAVDDSFDLKTAYDIIVVRRELSAHSYTRYQSITLAENVSEKTVAYMNEHADTLTGVSIEEETIRRYYGGESFSSIIGYTGKISDSEYEEYSAKDSTYTANDTVGKAGLEQYYESYLRGQNGKQEVYVNNVGKISKVISKEESQAGDDLYITIDSELQETVYSLLEQEIAGILYSNIKEGNIDIIEVYKALIHNNVININHFSEEDAGDQEKALYEVFSDAIEQSLHSVENELTTDESTINNDLSDEMLDYVTYIISMLKSNEVLLESLIDSSDPTFQKWKDGKLSLQEYLKHCISKQWIDLSKLEVNEKYSDTEEVYDLLCNYILTQSKDAKEFAKIVYEYLIEDQTISGKQLCLILFEQGVLDYDDTVYENIINGTTSAYTFLMDKINNMEITPAQLALDPCSGSCVLTDTTTGEIRALVSYPGYDNNKMANGVDAEYYAGLQSDKSNPLYNYATQEKTAPGSTFKMVTSTAALSESIINEKTEIQCTGVFKEVDNEPKCWIYPSTHKSINVSEALRDSCNVFYYTLGYNLSTKGQRKYNEQTGIDYIQKYASIYGLNEKTGLEIEENKPDIATEYPVMAAIGQSNHNFTTVSLSRYVTAVSSGKLYNYELLSKVVDSKGETVKSHDTEYKDISDTLDKSQWKAIRNGMRMVCEELDSFDNFDISCAGKTGTAQQVESRPNHALFVGYAPYKRPKVSIAVRISFGYTSHNAAAVAKNIMSCYFGKEDVADILSKNASGATSSTSSSITD